MIPERIHWFALSIERVLEEAKTNLQGLAGHEAEARLRVIGPNTLKEKKADSFLVLFGRQFLSPLIYVLFVAALIVFAMGHTTDGGIILFVLFFNALVGSIQEGRAQNTLLALKKFVETNATVVREGKEIIVDAAKIVPGDIIILQEGEKVPADARIIFSNALRIDESSLTGESEPVHKISESINRNNTAIASQKNMVWGGTHVVGGNGKVVVVATGTSTEIGKVFKEISLIESDIPLKKEIARLSNLIVVAVLGFSVTLFFLGISSGKSTSEMFATAVALAVATIPEGLPIVITLVLATGVWRMAKRNALVKRLQAVEALGQARILAVDKTGTITQNEIVVQKIYTNGTMFEVGGVGYEPLGDIRLGGNSIEPLDHPELLLLGKASAFSANARVEFLKEQNIWRVSGDPTEAAMLVLAEKIGFKKIDLEQESPRRAEISFDYGAKYHAVLHTVENRNLLAVAGAPEVVLAFCSSISNQGNVRSLAQKELSDLESIFHALSAEGLRVVALAIKEHEHEVVSAGDMKGLTFLGLLGMRDALRPEARGAILAAENAGMKVVMMTGDHVITARAIAKEAGIFKEGDAVLTGKELESLSESHLAEKIKTVSVFARVTPEDKLRIIRAYQRRGEIIAMTGDGVNDAPSLVAADLGIAMGKIGTEVAKEAASIVLLDDNFGSIIGAIEEGRTIYRTIKKVILYLFSTNVGEVFVISGAVLLGYPLPILPAQIIWLNLVTDSFLDVALAMEPKEQGLLSKKFEKAKKYLFDSLMLKRMFLMALPMTIGTLVLFRGFFETDLEKALTMSLTTLAVFQWFNAWNCRSEVQSIFRTNPFSNPYLISATIFVVLLQLIAVYSEFMNRILHTVPLTLRDWALIIGVAFSIILVEEVRKLIHRSKKS